MKNYLSALISFITLRWTTKPPTIEGLYRAAIVDGRLSISMWVEIRNHQGGLVAVFFNTGYEEQNEPLTYFTHWFGPLPAPRL